MAVSSDTLRLTRDLRIRVASTVDDRLRDLITAWARAWDEISDDLTTAVDQLVAASKAGRWPSRAKVNQITRDTAALAVAADALDKLSHNAGVTIAGDLAVLAVVTARAQARIIASQFPPAAGNPIALGIRFDRADPNAIEAIVRRSTEQITKATYPLSADATREMKRALIRGVAVGQNPRAAARAMVRRVQGAFNGGRNRALVIARTEMLDAHRAAARVQQAANSDVLAGWVWHSVLSARTCPACWAQHGTEHRLSEPGPYGHQSCRCSRTPLTKSWADLGFPNITEPKSLLPDAEAKFRSLAPATQLKIMGPGRLAALKAGRASWSDMAVRRPNPGWRPAYYVTPLRDLVGGS